MSALAGYSRELLELEFVVLYVRICIANGSFVFNSNAITLCMCMDRYRCMVICPWPGLAIPLSLIFCFGNPVLFVCMVCLRFVLLSGLYSVSLRIISLHMFCF